MNIKKYLPYFVTLSFGLSVSAYAQEIVDIDIDEGDSPSQKLDEKKTKEKKAKSKKKKKSKKKAKKKSKKKSREESKDESNDRIAKKSKELIDAIDKNDYNRYEELISQGADINYTGKGLSPFARVVIRACKKGEADGLKIMLDHLPNIWICSDKGENIFSIIHDKARLSTGYSNIMNSYYPYTEEVCRVMINLIDFDLVKSEEEEKDTYSPVRFCALRGYTDCLQYLMNMGVEADDGAPGEVSTLTKIIDVFSVAMNGVPAVESYAATGGGMRSYHYRKNVEIINLEGIIKCFNILLKHGANVNHVARYRTRGGKITYMTPLSSAVKGNLVPIVERLINEGVDVNQTLDEDLNLFEHILITCSPKKEIVEMLIDAGGEVETNEKARERLERFK